MAGRSCSSSPPLVAVTDTSATAGTGKRKGPAATGAPKKARKPPTPKDYGTNKAFVYYGIKREDRGYMSLRNLTSHNYLTGELPQPRSMSLVDLQCWIINLFQLHPETQDLEIGGFFSRDCEHRDHPNLINHELVWEWRFDYFTTNAEWASYVRRVKRKNGMDIFILFADCSEIEHYESLFKVDRYGDGLPQVDACAAGQYTITQVLPEKDSLSYAWHAIRDRVKKNPAMTTTEIVAYVAETCGEQISHARAWRVKQKALELEFGTFYESYGFVPWFFQDRFLNHRIYADIKDTEVAGCKGFRVLQSIFWTFAQCRQAFVSCRPVLCIKSMPLCGKYQGVLLTAIALDANDNYIPVAFAVAESESLESWLWFLTNLKRGVVKERHHVCVIHDYKRELLDSIDMLQNNQEKDHAWRDLKSRWCMHHLAENFLSHFGDEKLMTLFNRLCQQNQPSKFVKIWNELDKLTLEHKSEKEGGASAEVQQESVEHDVMELQAQRPCNRDGSAQNVEEGNNSSERNGNRTVLSFSEWIHQKPMEKWSLLHDRFGARYSVMGINKADLNNNYVLKGINCLPLAGMLEMTFQRMAEYFNSKSAVANKAMGNPLMNFPECIQDEMYSKIQKSRKHQVTCIVTKDKNYSLEKVDEMFKVQLKEKHVIVHLKSIYTRSKKDRHSAGSSHARCGLGKDFFYTRQDVPIQFAMMSHEDEPNRTSWHKLGDLSTTQGLRFRKTATCSCNKPQLHHKPCSHVIAVCLQIGASIATYVSPYYSLANLVRTWKGKKFHVPDFKHYYRCYKSLDSFAFPWGTPWDTIRIPTWIPNKKLACSVPAFQTSDCIHTGMGKEDQQCITESREVPR